MGGFEYGCCLSHWPVDLASTFLSMSQNNIEDLQKGGRRFAALG